jgi:Coenzyme PQQ synthesis protein D (PqqD)
MEPRARTHGILMETLDDEVLVFDERTEKCHVLNRVAAAVWRRCDGHTSRSELATVAAEVSGLPAREEIVSLALGQLATAGLLETPISAPGSGLSRRALIRRLGLAAGLAALLPAVESMVAPQPAQAQSPPVQTFTKPS